jgi:acyl-CoA synthetase (AMP-forming)/AMP-acid ligase II
LTWLLTYSPFRWAGISVISHSIINDLEIIIPKSINPLDVLKKIHLVTAISMTPSFFKKLLLFTNDKKKFYNIKQITFGGEYTNQPTLDLAKKIFPNARLTSIYAISEIGDICTSSDGKEGFNKKKFKKFKIFKNELIINKKKTNDLWKLKKNRYIFLGRKNDIINIGGNTISLQIVKEELNKIKEIKLFRLTSLKNPILGNIIQLEYVSRISQKNIEKKLLKKLPKYAVPIIFKKLKNIKLNSNNKV